MSSSQWDSDAEQKVHLTIFVSFLSDLFCNRNIEVFLMPVSILFTATLWHEAAEWLGDLKCHHATEVETHTKSPHIWAGVD